VALVAVGKLVPAAGGSWLGKRCAPVLQGWCWLDCSTVEQLRRVVCGSAKKKRVSLMLTCLLSYVIDCICSPEVIWLLWAEKKSKKWWLILIKTTCKAWSLAQISRQQIGPCLVRPK